MTSHQKGFLQVAVGSICFGFIGLFGKEAYALGLNVGQPLSFRFLIATMCLGIGLGITHPQSFRLPKKSFLTCAALGLFGYAAFSTFYFLAVQGVSVSLAALLLYTYPFWTVVINGLMGEKLRRPQWLGIIAAALGLVLLLWGQMQIHSPWALGAGVAAAVSYAAYVIISGRTLKSVSSMTSGFWIILFATIGLALFHRPSFTVELATQARFWIVIMSIAIIGTVIPLVLIQAGLRRLSSSETAILSMIEPVTAALASYFWFQEVLSFRQWVGAFLVLGSLWLTQRPRPSSQTPPAGSTEV